MDRSIQAKHPEWPPRQQVDLREATFKKMLAEMSVKVNAMVEKTALYLYHNKILSKEPDYLMEVDPYYYLELTERLVEKKPLYAQTKGRTYFNERMLAPGGFWYPMDDHPYVGFFLYKAVTVFIKDMPLKTAVGYVPLLLAALCLIPFFAICRHIFSLGPGVSFLGGTYLLVCPVFFASKSLGMV